MSFDSPFDRANNSSAAPQPVAAPQPDPPFASWAIVELMGHRRRPGYVREVEVFGAKLLRVDVPTPAGDLTEFYGASAIYCVRPCSETTARSEADGFYGHIQPRLLDHVTVDDGDEDDRPF